MAQSIAISQPVAGLRTRRGTTLVTRFLRHRSAVIGAAILLTVFLVAILSPLLVTHDPLLLDPATRFTVPGKDGHILGSDNFGRDVFSRTVRGTVVSLEVGLGVAVFTVLAGGIIGLVAGFFQKLDSPLMRVMDSMMAFPGVILALAIMAARGPSVGNVIFSLSVVSTPRLARVVRSIVLTIRELQYVEAAHALGVGNPRIILRHVLPNALSPIIVQSTFIFAEAVLGEAGLSFLGVGTPPEIPSWGNMLGEARAFLSSAPWTMVAPGAALMVTVLALNLLGDGIRDLIDPRLRKQ
jgi:peptide/nickel transport system permease protein